MKLCSSQLSALTRIFSVGVFRELAQRGRSALFRRLVDQANIVSRCESHATVGDIFNAAFDSLKTVGLRDEYVYKAAITQKVLMGKHSLRTASMLHEFRVGSNKADIVILNGTATVYEIKSERDSLSRLVDQISGYRRVFSTVNVITCKSSVSNVMDLVPENVGILSLTNRYQISVEREAIDCYDNICPSVIFDSLRNQEAGQILEAFGLAIPDVPNTRLRDAMRHSFESLDPVCLHEQMVRTLKHTRNLAPLIEFVDQMPESLRAAALTTPLRRADHSRLMEVIRIPYAETEGWV